jgi:hypothetical protein
MIPDHLWNMKLPGYLFKPIILALTSSMGFKPQTFFLCYWWTCMDLANDKLQLLYTVFWKDISVQCKACLQPAKTFCASKMNPMSEVYWCPALNLGTNSCHTCTCWWSLVCKTIVATNQQWKTTFRCYHLFISYLFDYCSFGRIILNISDMSTIFVNNSLLGTKIEQVRWGNWIFPLLYVRISWYCTIDQAFPNLNATVAFNFVFKPEENQRLGDLPSLQKKTMVSLLLLWKFLYVRQFGLTILSN